MAVVVGVIIAIGVAVGAAAGLWQFGEGVKRRQEEVGEGIAKAITWVTLAAGICLVLGLLVFFMTRSRAAVTKKGIEVKGGGPPAKS